MKEGSEDGWEGITFEGAAFEEAECVHAEFFEILGQDELAGRVGAREGFAVASEDVDGLFSESVTDVFEHTLRHTGGG